MMAANGQLAGQALADPNHRRRNSHFARGGGQLSFKDNVAFQQRPNQSNIWSASNNEMLVNQEYKPIRVDSSFVPSIEIAQNIPMSSQNASEYGQAPHNNLKKIV